MFKALLSEMGEEYKEKRNEQVTAEALANFDENQDGVVQFEEFTELMNYLITEKGYELK
ncbi:MAG: hypothetical protein MJ252_08170 [archaeon]|nr:hypothetical protein [archaeon]